MAEYLPETVAWLQRWGFCWKCKKRGFWPWTLSGHHLVRGTAKHKDDIKTIVILCPWCHMGDEHGTTDKCLGLLGSLVLKKRYDPANYDLSHVNAIRCRGPDAIQEAEVDAESQRMEELGL
jgi:hypothetical protein